MELHRSIIHCIDSRAFFFYEGVVCWVFLVWIDAGKS